MTLDASETLVKSAGDLFLAPANTSAPTAANLGSLTDLSGLGYVHAGWLHEDGPSPEGFEGENTKIYGWNAIAPIRSITRITEPVIPVSLLQWNAENLTLYFPGATHDVPNRVLTIPEGGNPEESTLLLRVADGSRWIGVWVALVSPRGGGAFEFPGDGVSPIPIAFDVLATGDPSNWVKFIGIDAAGDLNESV